MSKDQEHNHQHDHEHGEGHDHPHDPIEEEAGARRDFVLLEMAVRELLIEKGVFSAEDVTRQIDDMDSRTPTQGQKIVAKFWTDPVFRALALKDGKAAAEQAGCDMLAAPELVILENTPALHHVVVCTLCSCYPRAVLGIPPAWYKSKEYRSRVVADPRGVLAEFGTTVADGTEIRVVDSTADIRYLVVPIRPAGTERLTEAQLAEWVTRDSMIGVGHPRAPGAAQR
jgi:nitrile hydratase alpha subunit